MKTTFVPLLHDLYYLQYLGIDLSIVWTILHFYAL